MIECACSVAASACWSNSGINELMPIIRAKGFSSFPSCNFFGMHLGAVSLTFRELRKLFSRKYTTPEITFMVKLCMCAQSKALGTRTKFQLEILIISIICVIHKFREKFLGSSRNVSETAPRCVSSAGEEARGRSWLCWFAVFSRR